MVLWAWAYPSGVYRPNADGSLTKVSGLPPSSNSKGVKSSPTCSKTAVNGSFTPGSSIADFCQPPFYGHSANGMVSSAGVESVSERGKTKEERELDSSGTCEDNDASGVKN